MDTTYISGEARYKRGDRQTYCLTCEKWMFWDECTHNRTMDGKGFDRLMRQLDAGKITEEEARKVMAGK